MGQLISEKPNSGSPETSKEGIILASASYEAGGDAARDANTKAAVEKAGYELPPPELPPVDAARMATPQEARAQLERNIQRYGKQVEQAKEKYRDWEHVVGQADIFIGQEAQVALLESDNATDAVYYLATHPEIAKKLGRMAPASAISEVARISAMLPKPARADSRPRRPSESFLASASFDDVAKLPNYPGKARDLKRCRG